MCNRYYATITLATVGYGDLHAYSPVEAGFTVRGGWAGKVARVGVQHQVMNPPQFAFQVVMVTFNVFFFACECKVAAVRLAVGGSTAPTPTHGTTRLH